MRLTRACEYGIRALVHLASQGKDKACLISEISAFQDIPEKFLAKILQSLSRGGLVKSYRGVKGGFFLARAPEEITLREIVECLDGPMAINRCLTDPAVCGKMEGCTLRPVLLEAQDKLLKVLAGVSLKHLASAPGK